MLIKKRNPVALAALTTPKRNAGKHKDDNYTHREKLTLLDLADKE